MHLELLSRSSTDACRDVDGGIVAHIGESTVTITQAEKDCCIQFYRYVIRMDNLEISGKFASDATEYVGALQDWVSFATYSAEHCLGLILDHSEDKAEQIDVWAFAHDTELQELREALRRKVIVPSDRPDESWWLHSRED